jgi:hypothetical protein
MAMNREALREELMIQEVILESLQGETFDDAEEQREDAKKEISRLKRALRALPKTTSGDEGMYAWYYILNACLASVLASLYGVEALPQCQPHY